MKNSWYEFFLSSFFHKTQVKKTHPQKMPEEIIKNTKKRMKFERAFFITTFFLVLCKFRIVEWRQKGRGGRACSRLKSYCFIQKFIVAWKNLWKFCSFADFFNWRTFPMKFCFEISRNASKMFRFLIPKRIYVTKFNDKFSFFSLHRKW